MAQTKSLYLTKVQLKAELDRCLNCANKPCMNACPVNCSPQEFISHAKNGDFEQAVATITRNNPMGQTCGLICPDKFCMKACTRSRIDFAVNIPKVQATILENYRNPSAEAKAIRPNGARWPLSVPGLPVWQPQPNSASRDIMSAFTRLPIKSAVL